MNYARFRKQGNRRRPGFTVRGIAKRRTNELSTEVVGRRPRGAPTVLLVSLTMRIRDRRFRTYQNISQGVLLFLSAFHRSILLFFSFSVTRKPEGHAPLVSPHSHPKGKQIDHCVYFHVGSVQERRPMRQFCSGAQISCLMTRPHTPSLARREIFVRPHSPTCPGQSAPCFPEL